MFLIFGGLLAYPNGGAAAALGLTLEERDYYREYGRDIQWIHVLDVAANEVHPVESRPAHSDLQMNRFLVVDLATQEHVRAITFSDGTTEFTADGGQIGRMTGFIPKD